ncbi:MAG: helix-turn-helix domain-containing protein [Micromonosporaceae bacterium]|jgi:hypothetical protein
MQGELQRIVDALAARAGTPALLEDRGQRVLAYSEHTGPMDAVRRESILRRHATPEVIAWFRNAGIMEAREPLRTPACPELGLLPRVCVPVRHNDQLLGFVWFIDADGTLADTGIVDPGLMRELSLALYRQSLLGELASHREKEATRMLLDDNADVRAQAAQLLLEEGVVTDGDPTVALVALLATAPGRSHDDKARLALEQALAGTRRWLGTREALHLVRHDHGVLLIPGGTAGRPSPEVAAKHLDDGLRHAIRELRGVERAVVGIGQPRSQLVEAVGSYQEALQAARVGVQMPSLGHVVSWSSLGIYRVLARIDPDQLDPAGVHPGIDRLLRDPANQALLETLECYLDLAGNAHATAEQLRLHRTTLYYRLRRVEELAATDLRDGNERLCLHLALKMARLTGRYPAQA